MAYPVESSPIPDETHGNGYPDDDRWSLIVNMGSAELEDTW